MKLPERMAEGNGTKQWIHCSTKFLVKMKNVFYFYLKIKGTFGPTQYLINKDLWHSTRNSAQYSLMTSMGTESEKEQRYV